MDELGFANHTRLVGQPAQAARVGDTKLEDYVCSEKSSVLSAEKGTMHCRDFQSSIKLRKQQAVSVYLHK